MNKETEIFGDWGDLFEAAIESIARVNSIDRSAVEGAFSCINLYFDKDHVERVRATTHAMNDAAKHARNLVEALKRLSAQQQNQLILSGAVTHFQVMHLHTMLTSDASQYDLWIRAGSSMRKGGSNPAAHAVAERMRRLFRAERRKITFGSMPSGDGPSTDFGKAVKHALGAFGIRSDWRRPTQGAVDKQIRIENRYSRIASKRKTQRAPLTRPDSLSIRTTWEMGQNIMVLSVRNRPEIPEHRVCCCRFRSGREKTDYAIRWFEGISAK